jgi:hypothetical protein
MSLKLTIILFVVLIILILGAVFDVARATPMQPMQRATFTPAPTDDPDATPEPTWTPDAYPAPYPAPAVHRHSAPKATPSGLRCARCERIWDV